MTDIPPPIAIQDQELKKLIKHFHRLRWYGVAVLAAIIILAAVIFGILLAQNDTTLRQDNARLAASCGFYRDIATAPVVPTTGAKPTPLGVRIITDSRSAFTGQRCAGPLPPPSQDLRKWASYYHIPVNGR